MIIKKDEWWVPINDTCCYKAASREVNNIDAFMTYVTNKKVCIQAGGNLGLWPKKLSSLFETVYTFEPEEVNWLCLQKNIEGVNNIKSYNCALGSENGTVSIDRHWPSNAGSYRVKPGNEVSKITIDSLEINDVGLIQFDIEGSEHEAIIGSIKTIKKWAPVIVLELKGIGKIFGYTNKDTINLLDSLGYTVATKIEKDLVFIKTKSETSFAVIPADEREVLEPLVDVSGQPVKSMLELGNKKNKKGVYKRSFEIAGIDHTSVDWNGLNGALKLDLQTPVYKELGLFDVITNFGTTEHVESQYPVWENIHNMLRVGGLFVSTTPSNDGSWWKGNRPHGMWYPTKEFYKEFANLNGYRIEKLYTDGDFPYVLVYCRMYKVEDKPFTMPPLNLIVKQVPA